jgi:hypothetical protein
VCRRVVLSDTPGSVGGSLLAHDWELKKSLIADKEGCYCPLVVHNSDENGV